MERSNTSTQDSCSVEEKRECPQSRIAHCYLVIELKREIQLKGGVLLNEDI